MKFKHFLYRSTDFVNEVLIEDENSGYSLFLIEKSILNFKSLMALN